MTYEHRKRRFLSKIESVKVKVWIPGQQWQHRQGTCEKCSFLGPTPDLLTQKLWGKGPEISVLPNSQGGSEAC